MLQLLASAPEDGWAFVRKGDTVLLARPPYRQTSVVDEETVEKALKQGGFVMEERSFPDWSQLLAYLKQRLVEFRQAQGRGAPDTETIRGLLHYAPLPILVNFLDRVERELLPNRELQPAQELLTRLLSVDLVRSESWLYQRTLALLTRCQQEIRAKAEQRVVLTSSARNFQQRFPSASKRYGSQEIFELRQGFQRQGTPFAFAASA